MDLFRRKVLVQGVVDVLTDGTISYGSLLYPGGVVLDKEPPSNWGAIIRKRFASARDRKMCLRPDWNNHPEQHYLIPTEWAFYVRIGHFASALAIAEPVGSCLGRVTKIEAVNGMNPKQAQGLPNWLALPMNERLPLGPTPFDGPLSRLLMYTHACPGAGDRVTLIAPSETGKSYFLADLLRETRPGIWPMMGLSERPEEIRDYGKARPDAIQFVSLVTQSGLQRLHNAELCFHAAMRLAEMGTPEHPVDVVILFDGITKGVADALKSLPAPKNVGIEPGGVNPLTRDLIAVLYNVAGRYVFGTITLVATVLNEGTSTSDATIEVAQNVGLGAITLTTEHAIRGVFPALEFSVDTRQGKTGSTVSKRSTNCRRCSDWMDPRVEKAASDLQFAISITQAEQEEMERNDLTRSRPDRILVRGRAVLTAGERLMHLKQMADRGDPPAAVFAHFRIKYEPEAEVIFPAIPEQGEIEEGEFRPVEEVEVVDETARRGGDPIVYSADGIDRTQPAEHKPTPEPPPVFNDAFTRAAAKLAQEQAGGARKDVLNQMVEAARHAEAERAAAVEAEQPVINSGNGGK